MKYIQWFWVEATTIRIMPYTKNELDKLKIKGRSESYEDVINRLIRENHFSQNTLMGRLDIEELGKIIAEYLNVKMN